MRGGPPGKAAMAPPKAKAKGKAAQTPPKAKAKGKAAKAPPKAKSDVGHALRASDRDDSAEHA